MVFNRTESVQDFDIVNKIYIDKIDNVQKDCHICLIHHKLYN